VGCRGCRQSPGTASWGSRVGVRCRLLHGPAPQEVAAPHSSPLLAGCMGQRAWLAGSLRDRQHKHDPGSSGWLRGRVSNRGEDGPVIIYTLQRKDLLGIRWQASGVTKMSQASQSESSSGKPATQSHVSAPRCHTAPSSASTTEVCPPLHRPQEARSHLQHPSGRVVPRPHSCQLIEGGQRGWSWGTHSLGIPGGNKQVPLGTAAMSPFSRGADKGSPGLCCRMCGSFATRKLPRS